MTRNEDLERNADAVTEAIAAGQVTEYKLMVLRHYCIDWHGGQFTDAYAFASSGHLGCAVGAAQEVLYAVRKSGDGFPDDEMEGILNAVGSIELPDDN